MNAAVLAPYVPRMLLGRDIALRPAHWRREGTLMFADVSGFTRLTETLSRRGKIGAEQIVGAISSVFTRLLEASTDGGDVLKFSGDALLVFFDGPDHPQRACHAAVTMRRVLRDLGGVDAPGRRVRLRMSVGIHTGRFHFFLCGGDHLELFVLGADASTTMALEAAAAGNEVRVSETTAAMLHRAQLAPVKGRGVRLRTVPHMAPVPVADPGARRGLERLIAPPLRTRLADNEHEHRRATVAFAHVGRVDGLLRERGPDEVFARVQALTSGAMAALDEHGVLLTATDVGADGGVFMLTAGAPDATGDDEVRMLRVARRMVDMDCGLPVRVGVHSGGVFVGAVGAPFRRTYSTMGAATNLAARVLRRAAWGEVLATAAVTDPLRGRFVLRPLPPFTARGVRQPVSAAAVCDEQEPSTAPAVLPPLVGREAELRALSTAITGVGRAGGDMGAAGASGAEQMTGVVIELVGAAGVGKSRLIDEVRAAAEHVEWVDVHCDPYARAAAYLVARVLLRRVLGIARGATPAQAGDRLATMVAGHAPDLEPWLPLLAVPVGAQVAPTATASDIADRYRRTRTHAVVCDLLAALPVRPMVWVIEDAHNMDDASAELIAAVLDRVVATRPWAVLVARRPADRGLGSDRGYRALDVPVAPLDAATSLRLAHALAERTPLPVHLLPELVARADGNPLFLAELVAAQAETTDELPRSIEAMLAARIDALAPVDRRALRQLSVLGDRFSRVLVDAVFGPSDMPAARLARLDQFVRAEGDRYAFRSALVRQVAYEGLSFTVRRRLHGQVADALTGSSDLRAGQLPVHLARAERWEEAWTASLRAAGDARDSGANAVAGELYEMALGAARRLDLPAADAARAAEGAGEAWEQAGVFGRALQAYATAASLTASPGDRLLLALRRARVHESAGRYPAALRACSRALADLEAVPLPERARCEALARVRYASVRLVQGRAGDSVDHGERAVALAATAGDDVRAEAYRVLGAAHAALGDHAAASRCRDLALPLFAAVGDLAAQGTVLHDLGADALRAGRLEEALWLYERGHEAWTRAGNVVRAASATNAIGDVLLTLRRLPEARARFAESLRVWRGARAPEGVAIATGNLGRVALAAGRPELACGHFEEALAAADEGGFDSLAVPVLLPFAQALLALGRYVEAWDVASSALTAAADPVEAASAHRIRAQALSATGGERRAADELTHACRLEGRD